MGHTSGLTVTSPPRGGAVMVRPHPSFIGKWLIRRNHISNLKGWGPHRATVTAPPRGGEVTRGSHSCIISFRFLELRDPRVPHYHTNVRCILSVVVINHPTVTVYYSADKSLWW